MSGVSIVQILKPHLITIHPHLRVNISRDAFNLSMDGPPYDFPYNSCYDNMGIAGDRRISAGSKYHNVN